jgi:hypothetical protein
MNPDEFEKRLHSQPLRQVPGDWRREILRAARQAAGAQHAPHPPHHVRAASSLLSAIHHQVLTILWPHPIAWAGLAAVWLVILGVHLTMGQSTPLTAKRALPTSPQVFMAHQEQERLLAELLGPREAPVAVPPKASPPRPRSERRHSLLMA